MQVPGQSNNFHSCNYRMYAFNGSTASQTILILSYSLLAIFLLVQMCRLCSKVFSYHKFHIHQAYRFYTIAFFSSVIIIIQKITQLKLSQAQSANDDQSSGLMPDYTVIYGMRIMNEIMGVLSISVTNIMYVVIGFTWLNIIWGCDFNEKSQNITDTFQSIDQQPISQINQIRSGIEQKKQELKFKIKWTKNISFYFLYPLLLIFATFATLDRSPFMCQLALVDLMISTQLGYILLGYSFILYLKKRFKDPSILLWTKGLIIYLLIAMTMRMIWFCVIAIEGSSDHSNQVYQVIYNILISVFPILALSWLSEKQLSKQTYSLVKSQRVLLMQSTLI